MISLSPANYPLLPVFFSLSILTPEQGGPCLGPLLQGTCSCFPTPSMVWRIHRSRGHVRLKPAPLQDQTGFSAPTTLSLFSEPLWASYLAPVSGAMMLLLGLCGSHEGLFARGVDGASWTYLWSVCAWPAGGVQTEPRWEEKGRGVMDQRPEWVPILPVLLHSGIPWSPKTLSLPNVPFHFAMKSYLSRKEDITCFT